MSKITLGKLFASDPDKFIEVLSEYSSRIDKKEYVEELNKHYGLNYSFATWSRAISLILDVKDILHVENTIFEDVIKLKLDRKKISNEKVALNRLYTEISRKELLVDKFYEYQNNEPVFNGTYDSIDNTFKEDTLMFVSDTHYDGDMDNLSRAMGFVKSNLKLALNGNTVKLFITGDIIQGYLRIDDILNEQWDPVKQSVEFTQCFIQYLGEFKNRCLEIILIPGNHDELRVVNGLKGVNNPTVMSYFYALLKSEGFNVVLTDEYVGSIKGNTYKVIHGHTHFGKNAIKKYNQNENYKLFHAHLHHFYVSENIVGLPSLAKSNSYEKALGIKEGSRGILVYEANDNIEVLKEITMRGEL
jgi:metallophosphoesterase superfamily enzyme